MTLELTEVIAAVVVSLLGNGILANYLFRRLEGQQQRELTHLRSDLERDIRTLQTSLDRTVFVHRVQFETEFAALKDMWQHLATARAKMGLVRPMMDIRPAGETSEQKQAREFERYSAFVAALNELVESVHSQSPFIPKEIYERLDVAIRVAKHESTEVQLEYHDRERDPIRDWYKRGKEHYNEFCDAADTVSNLIRGRLERLAIVRE